MCYFLLLLFWNKHGVMPKTQDATDKWCVHAHAKYIYDNGEGGHIDETSVNVENQCIRSFILYLGIPIHLGVLFIYSR